MDPFIKLLLFFAALGAWPTWLVMRRQRRARGTHGSHLPGRRKQVLDSGAKTTEAANAAYEVREFGGL